MVSPSPPASSTSSSLSPPSPKAPVRRPSLVASATGTPLNGSPNLASAVRDPISRRSSGAGGSEPQSTASSSNSLELPATPPKRRRSSGRRSPASTEPASAASTSSNQPGTFLARFLGSFRPPSSVVNSRPSLPRSLSSPIHLAREFSSSSSNLNPPPLPEHSISSPDAPSPTTTNTSDSTTTSLSKRLRPKFSRSRSQASASPTSSPTASPLTSPTLATEPPRMSPGSPATLRGRERDPMETAIPGEHYGTNSIGGGEGSNSGTPRGDARGGISRRESMLSQRTLLAHDRTSTAGSLSGGIPLGSPLRPIEEPEPTLQVPHFDQSLQLIATLLPPALLLLSHLGPTHLFSPPMKIPNLFEVALNSSVSGSTDAFDRSDNHISSDRASIASTATGDTATTSASFLPALPTADHLRPSHSHELYAPSSLSVPAVSAAAIWRLFRGFEWIGQVGKGEQPRPPSPSLHGSSRDLNQEDEPEEVFDFPAMLQGVSDVLAADTAARGIELVIGQVGNGSAPSPAATPISENKGREPVLGEKATGQVKDVESRELLVKADERAWSVALVWILHHIIAGASTGSTIEVRFLATANHEASASVAGSSAASTSGTSSTSASAESKPNAQARKWWTVSLEILHQTAPPTLAHPYGDDNVSSPGSSAPAPHPPFDTPFAKALFSHVGFELGKVESGVATDSSAQTWILEGLLPSARPKPYASDDPSSLLGRRRASLESMVGQEPTMGDLKRFAEGALKGHRVALHASDQSAFAKHLTMYLAGWGMDVQHVPLDGDGPLSSGSSSHGLDSKRPSAGSRFDSGFAGTDSGTPPSVGFGSSHSDGSHKSPDLSANEPNSNLVIIDDDVSTLRRLLVALRAPPLVAPTLISKRPQLATRRARSSPAVRQLHQLQQPAPSQWVIVYFANLTNYKTIKEVVADALATSRSPSLPEVLVIPKPAGPRRIVTALWTALKRPAVDPFLPPIATSPTSPGIQYWTPRLSPALAKEQQDFDFSHGSEGSGSKSGDGGLGPAFGKPRTPPTYFSPSSFSHPASNPMPPSPLGMNSESQDSYFSSVADELKEATPSEGMVIQSPDGRSGIFFQPQTRASRSMSSREKPMSRPMERVQAAENGARDHGHGAREMSSDPTAPPSRVATATPGEIGLGPGLASRRTSGNSTTNNSDPTSPVMPLGTPALHLDSFISAAKSRANGEDVSPEELPPPDGLTRQGSLKRPSATVRHSNSSGGSVGSSAPSSHGGSTTNSPKTGPASRRTMSGAPSPIGNVPPSTPLPPAAQGAAAAAKAALSKTPTSPSSPRNAFARSRTSTAVKPPKGKRRASRKNTLPSVPPIRVLIVEDNKINQTILSVFMKKRGIKCEVAVDGDQAVEKWKKGNFHLVLMDIQLPVKDGIEATREIRELERANNVGTFIMTPTSDLNSPMSNITNPLSNPGSPLLHMPVIIVALTASSLQADRVNALAAGCNDFLTKPVSLPWLETKLVEWGSMAYLSGFSRKVDSPEAASAVNTTILGVPRPPVASTGPPTFSEGINSKADVVRGHLHIDRGHRPESPNTSPESTSAQASPALDAGTVPPVPVNSIEPSRATNPSLTITSPTPGQTPNAKQGPVGPVPTKTKTTLDKVEEKLEDLVQEQEERSPPHRPGPTPLPPSVVGTPEEPSLDSVLAEGARLAELGRARSDSASFGQAIIHSGVSSTRGSDDSIARLPAPPSEK